MSDYPVSPPDNIIIPEKSEGVELRIRGVVQGVGFRPFIYRLACKYGYAGFVANTGNGVKIRIDQVDEHLEEFVNDIRRQAPPLARMDSIDQARLVPENLKKFSILASRASDVCSVAIPPDVAVCDDCLREMFNPADRRYLYPFINCTNCGPRFSIIEGLPYDRPLTAMRRFTMCRECAAEYNDPASRRFHAQPNCCSRCGPVLSLHGSDGVRLDCLDPIGEAARALACGQVVAIRGLGGFHLAADGASEEVVRKIREIKGRVAKPLAVMLAAVEAVKKYCYVNEEEERLLTSFRRPIVLLRRKGGSEPAAGLAPGLGETGILLPYAPVHHLLFSCPEIPEALVMTSANISGEPIIADNREALDRLSGLVDFFLLHNREITHPLDDSVARIVSGRTRLIRRARGYVPEPVKLEHDFPNILACGGQSKNTFCFVKEGRAFLSQHMGTLDNPGVFNRYRRSIDFLGSLLDVNPEIVACDLHPDYLSSRIARSYKLPLYEIQHHHAHAAAIMAEKGLTEKCLAVIMDGAGLGPDKTIWGGEVLLTDCVGYERLACLQPMPMPGGDLAAREIDRMGFAAWWLARESEDGKIPSALQGVPEKRRAILAQMIGKGFNTPYTSSCGRLFDGIACLLGLRNISYYEGQSGMELETLAYRSLGGSFFTYDNLKENGLLPVSLDNEVSPAIILSAPMIGKLMDLRESGWAVDRLALELHVWLISSITAILCRILSNSGPKPVILGGGCLQNTLLLKGLEKSLATRGIRVYSSGNPPVNDGCLALGQAVIAGTLHRKSAGS